MASETEPEPTESIVTDWGQLSLEMPLLRGIYAYGFEHPSPIQQRAIAPIMAGRDVVVQAQSGTGKTATFVIGALARIDVTVPITQVLVLSPTRELTTQTGEVFSRLGCMFKSVTDKQELLRVQCVFGGMGGTSSSSSSSFARGEKVAKPHVVCGCPGRVLDMMKRKELLVDDMRVIVFDEADELFSSGFDDQVRAIVRILPDTLQVVVVSATLSEYTHGIINKLVRHPVRISVLKEALTLEGIKQYYIRMHDDTEKYETLKELYKFLTMNQSIIYCNSIRRVTRLHKLMADELYPVCCIHSDMTQHERQQSFQQFKQGQKRVLISSDVTARGIDVQQVSVVINYDVPKSVDTYLHRIGRSGRWGRKGVAINFVTEDEQHRIRAVEEHFATHVEELPVTIDAVFA